MLKKESGIASRHQAGAAPATVGGKSQGYLCHWGTPGRRPYDEDPRARRLAIIIQQAFPAVWFAAG